MFYKSSSVQMACPSISPVVRVPMHRRAIRVTFCESQGQWKPVISQTLSSSSWYTPIPERTTVSEAAGPLCHRWCDNNWAFPIILKQHSRTCLSEWRKIRKTWVFPPKAGWVFIYLQKLCTDISKFKCHPCWLIGGRWIPGDLGYLPEETQGQALCGCYTQKKDDSLACSISFPKSVKLVPSMCFHDLKFHFILQNQPRFPLSCLFCVSLTAAAN